MLRCRTVLAGLSLAAASGLGGQEVEVVESMLVLAAPTWGALVEPHVAAHPTEPDWLVAGVMVTDTAPAPSERNHCLSMVSRDGGSTWETTRMPFGNCADPWLVITGSGEAAFLALGRHSAIGIPGAMGLLVARSPDGGGTWSDTLRALGSAQDRPTMAADPRPSQPRSLVVFSDQGVRVSDRPVRRSVFVARSVDAGRSFRLPVNIIPSNLNLTSLEGVVLADGTILASFIDFQRNVVRDANTDRRAGMLDRRRIWMLRSTDDGRTFSPPLLATEDCGRGGSYGLAADISSGPRKGRVYLVCRRHDGDELIVQHSDDQSEIWTVASAVPGSGEEGRAAGHARVAVNGEGVVAIAWFETEGEPSAVCTTTLVSVSMDGGETFADAVPLAPASCPDADRNGFAYRRWRSGGDYFGLTAAADGRFHVLWPDARGGPFELWRTTFTVRD